MIPLTEKDVLLLQGVFFQNWEGLDIIHKSPEGIVPVIRSGMVRYLYAGGIWKDQESGRLLGDMQDQFGISELTEILIDDEHFTFKKKYAKRPDTMIYSFRKSTDGSWIGEYKGRDVGTGGSRCIVTPITTEFFDDERLLKELGGKTLHNWFGDRSKMPSNQ